VNGPKVTGKETPPGSDWFHFEIPYDFELKYITVHLTALVGTDPDLFLYNASGGNGSAPFLTGQNQEEKRFPLKLMEEIGSTPEFSLSRAARVDTPSSYLVLGECRDRGRRANPTPPALTWSGLPSVPAR